MIETGNPLETPPVGSVEVSVAPVALELLFVDHQCSFHEPEKRLLRWEAILQLVGQWSPKNG